MMWSTTAWSVMKLKIRTDRVFKAHAKCID